MSKVLLLNPPGKKYFIRDYYCSQISKGTYYWPPLDLLVLSGILKNHCEIKVLDALVAGLSREAANAIITSFSPDYIISLAGAASWNDDMDFLFNLKKIWKGCLVLSGDYPLARPQDVIKDYSFIDALLLDFTESDIVEFICQKKIKGAKNIITKEDPTKTNLICSKEFSMPVPLHEVFSLQMYHLPHLRHHPFATIMTDFGCPFNCTFCPFERIGYKLRSIKNIAEELQYLNGLKIREIWLRDQSFGSAKKHALDFCRLVKEFGNFFSWSCEMRVDAADEELFRAMKEAGCHTVMFGVETAQEKVLNAHKKGITIQQVRIAFRLAEKFGLKRLAHFILGLSGETIDSQLMLIDFALQLNPDYGVFNIAAPLWNTSFREEVMSNQLLIDDKIEVDSSCSYPVWESEKLKRSEIWRIRKLALRRFYLRPAYVLKQLRSLKTRYQLYMLFKEGAHLLCKVIG